MQKGALNAYRRSSSPQPEVLKCFRRRAATNAPTDTLNVLCQSLDAIPVAEDVSYRSYIAFVSARLLIRGKLSEKEDRKFIGPHLFLLFGCILHYENSALRISNKQKLYEAIEHKNYILKCWNYLNSELRILNLTLQNYDFKFFV